MINPSSEVLKEYANVLDASLRIEENLALALADFAHHRDEAVEPTWNGSTCDRLDALDARARSLEQRRWAHVKSRNRTEETGSRA